MSLHDATIEKGWKCGGAIFTNNPRRSDCCIDCETCTAVKGIILEDAESCRFISGDDF
jgi:hypothetical protein